MVISKTVTIVPPPHFCKIYLIFSHKSITSSSLKPIYGVNGPALSIVNWVKLFKADWVFNFFIGKIPVRYASAIYF